MDRSIRSLLQRAGAAGAAGLAGGAFHRGDRSALLARRIDASRDAIDASSASVPAGSRRGGVPPEGYHPVVNPPSPSPAIAARVAGRDAESIAAAKGCSAGASPGEPDGPERRGPEAAEAAAAASAWVYGEACRAAVEPPLGRGSHASVRRWPAVTAVRDHCEGGLAGWYCWWCCVGCRCAAVASCDAWRRWLCS